jgi:DNA (cytosine-5)-methyltransferase 1
VANKVAARSRDDQRCKGPSAVSLFSGAGGFCEGVRLADYDVLCAVDDDRHACRTHSANFPEVPLFAGDIRRFLRDEQPGVPGKENLTTRGIDLVYGGSPCQGFSQIGPRDPKDPRNSLYREFVRIIRQLAPKTFIMENVPNILAMRNGGYRDQIVSDFQKAGYSRTAIFTLLASDFGVPQHRRRVFFIGLRDGLQLAGALQEVCGHLLAEQQSDLPVTVGEALSDLPRLVSQDDGPLPYPKLRPGRLISDYQRLMRLDCDTPLLSAAGKRARLDSDEFLYNHHTKGIEPHRQRIIEAIKPGMRGDSIQPVCGMERAHPNGGGSIPSARRTPFSRRCTAFASGIETW